VYWLTGVPVSLPIEEMGLWALHTGEVVSEDAGW